MNGNNLITTSTNALTLCVKDEDFPLKIQVEVLTALGKKQKEYLLLKTSTGALKMETK